MQQQELELDDVDIAIGLRQAAERYRRERTLFRPARRRSANELAIARVHLAYLRGVLGSTDRKYGGKPD